MWVIDRVLGQLGPGLTILCTYIVHANIRFTKSFGAAEDVSPSMCFQTSNTVESLATCFDKFTVPWAYYDLPTYNLAQPSDRQRQDWRKAVYALLSVDGNCSDLRVLLPESIQSFYTMASFQDFCVLYEKIAPGGVYSKGWGFMIVPATQAGVSRAVHFSAPHPQYDLGTVEQAASLFRSTGSRSLLVAGRTRTAFLDPSDCTAPTSGSQVYYKTDPAHNNLEPFFDASIVIYDWQRIHGGCPSSSCAFIQMHGKGTSTCSNDTVFLSSGLGNSYASWYTDSTDRPIKRLQHNLRLAFPLWNVSLPSESDCLLTATRNVVGRRINGINPQHVCSVAADSDGATGEWVHIEQATIARIGDSFEGWSQAITHSFPSHPSHAALQPITLPSIIQENKHLVLRP
ncbi:unnamed protein product [Cyclocybe aegerita]|uniref:Uncharacterized protein n=1 Tax=Cyclocybe aegerita TaxID=1973307 RepID=A0A8S0VVL9_CYCAE|nr:unnamed protein product [Cyclocybe aegerita]